MKVWWHKLLHNPFLASSFWVTVAYNVANFINFLANFYLVKRLSLDLYGEYASANAYVALLGIPISILALVIIQKIGARAISERREYFALLEKRLWATLKKTWWWWLGGGVILAAILSTWANLVLTSSVIFILIAFATSVLSSIYGACLQGEKSFKAYSLTLVLAATVKVAALVIFLSIWPELLWLAYFSLIISNLATIYVQRKWALPKKGLSVSQASRQKKIWPFKIGTIIKRQEVWLPVLAMIGVLAFINIDVILVKKFLTPEQSGLYGVVSLFAKIINYATMPMAQVAFAFGATQETAKHQRKNLWITVGLFTLFGLGMIAVYALIPGFLIELVAKSDYLSIGSLLWLAGIFGTLYSLNYVLVQFFVNRRSLIALGSVAFVLAQITAIYLNHQSFQQILFTNVILSAGLTFFFLGCVLITRERKGVL